MIRVLQVLNSMGNGGIDHFVMDRYRLIDRNKVQFDFLFLNNQPGYFDDEIKKLGGRIYKVPSMFRHPVKCFLKIKKLVKENKYSIVHRHSGNATAYFDLLAAKNGGAKTLILHSHNNSAGYVLLHKIFRALFAFPVTRVACSNSAGKWMFGKKSFTVFNNSIDVSKYLFNETKRQEIRKSLGIKKDTFVIGHVGRFDYQKNHPFLFKIFEQVKKKNANSKLVCVGDGFLKLDREKLAKDMSLSDDIIFVGDVKNTFDYYNTFDVFCLPSLYEGLPIVLIEAQANGLNCFVSKDKVTNESNVTGLLSFLTLEEKPVEWASKMMFPPKTRNNDLPKKLIMSKWNITNSMKDLYSLYGIK